MNVPTKYCFEKYDEKDRWPCSLKAGYNGPSRKQSFKKKYLKQTNKQNKTKVLWSVWNNVIFNLWNF